MKPKSFFSVAILILVIANVLAIALVLSQRGWYAIDFQKHFRPAALSLDPYMVDGFFSPPWTAWLMYPFALLPADWGQAMMATVALIVAALVCRKLKLGFVATLLLLTSYPMIYSLAYGQLEWMVLLGFLLPRPLGMVLLMVKPQLGLGVAIYWLLEAWQKDRTRGIATLLIPITWLTILVSWLYNWDPLMMAYAIGRGDAEVWPWSLLLVPLVINNLKQRKWSLGQFLTPHLTRGSWIGLLLDTSDDTYTLSLVSIASWIIGLFV